MGHPPIGIDLGLTTSSVCAYIDGRPTPIVDPATRSPIIPSVVALSRTGEVLVGQLALERGLPETIVRESKRGTGLGTRYQLGQRVMTSEEIAGLILGKLKSMAANQLGQAITDVVITVPANYEDTRRRAVKEAAAMAGLNVLRLINEPTAAAMAFGFKEVGAEEHLLVYDFGDSTLDVAILEMVEGVLDVRASHSVADLGGKQFDERIADWARAKYQTSNPGAQIDPTALAAERLRRAAEAAKRELSEAQTAAVFVANWGTCQGESVDLDTTLTRAEFEALVRPLVDQSLRAIDAALTKGNYQKSAITRLLLVGGTCYVPCVRQAVEQYMGKPIVAGIDADVAVAAGACINAALYTGDIDTSDPTAIIMQDVTTHGLGTIEYVGSDGERMAIYVERIAPNTPIPYSVTWEARLATPNQETMDIEVVQDATGRAMRPEDTVLIPGASAQIIGIPPSRSGAPHQVRITFSIDASGIAGLTASLPATGQEFTVTSHAHLTRHSPTTPTASATPGWEDSPLAAMHRPAIDRAEEALRSRPHNAAPMAKALTELKERLTEGDGNGAQAARGAPLELLIRDPPRPNIGADTEISNEPMAGMDHFEVLGVSESATADEVKRAWARKIREFPPDTAPAMNQRVNEAKRTLLDDKARANYIQQMRHGPAIEAAVRRAQEADARDDHHAAAAAYREALALAPDNQTLRCSYAISLYQSGNEAKGITVMEALVDRAPSIALYRFYLAGMILNEKGKDDATTRWRAHLHFEAAVRIEPNHVDYLVGLARCLRAMERYREAEATIEHALMSDGKLDIQDVDTLFELPLIHLYAHELDRVRADADRIMAVVRDLDQDALRYCANQFTQIAGELWEANAFEEVAVFLEAARRFDPNNTELRKAKSEADRQAAISREANALAADTAVAGPVKTLLLARALGELGQMDEAEYGRKTDLALAQLRTMSPAVVETSLATCRRYYPAIWALDAEGYAKWLGDLGTQARPVPAATPDQRAANAAATAPAVAAQRGAYQGPRDTFMETVRPPLVFAVLGSGLSQLWVGTWVPGGLVGLALGYAIRRHTGCLPMACAVLGGLTGLAGGPPGGVLGLVVGYVLGTILHGCTGVILFLVALLASMVWSVRSHAEARPIRQARPSAGLHDNERPLRRHCVPDHRSTGDESEPYRNGPCIGRVTLAVASESRRRLERRSVRSCLLDHRPSSRHRPVERSSPWQPTNPYITRTCSTGA